MGRALARHPSRRYPYGGRKQIADPALSDQHFTYVSVPKKVKVWRRLWVAMTVYSICYFPRTETPAGGCLRSVLMSSMEQPVKITSRPRRNARMSRTLLNMVVAVPSLPAVTRSMDGRRCLLPDPIGRQHTNHPDKCSSIAPSSISQSAHALALIPSARTGCSVPILFLSISTRPIPE